MAEAAGASPVSSLSEVFDSGSEQPAKASAEPETKDATEKDEGDQKFRAPDSSSTDEKSDKSESKPDADDEPADKEKVAKPAPDAAKDKEDKPSKEDTEKVEKDKWEAEDNPYLKRFRDTSANWNKEHQEKLAVQNQVAQMQREMATLRKIADGTYDPEKDDPARQVSPEDVATRALNVGKVLASKNAAISQFGSEKVNTDLAEFNSVFEGHEMINNLVLSAESPVHEAFRILDRFRFEKKYGSTPVEWHKSIRAEAEKELRASLTKEITEKLLGRAEKKDNTPHGLSSSRGSNGLSSGQNSKGKGHSALEDIFTR